MKLHFFISLFICLYSFTPFTIAQNFGIRVGLNLSNVNKPEIDTDSRFGLQIGPVVDFELSDDISLVAGVLYSQKGYKFMENGIEMDEKLSYIDIPIMIQIKFGKFYFEGGPGYYILLRAVRNGSVDTKNSFKGSDMGINAGLGVDLDLFRMDLRYGAGFGNIADNPDPDAEAFTNNLITVGISFFL